MSITSYLSKTGKTIRLTALAFSGGYITSNFIAEPILCSGPSMEPTISDRDLILVDKFSSIFTNKIYKSGEIVVSRLPSNPKTLICKRISAVAGETVKSGFLSQQVIPKGHVWLIGDNTSHSTDSRQFGPIPIGLILGKVVLKIWPIQDFQVFDSQPKNKSNI